MAQILKKSHKKLQKRTWPTHERKRKQKKGGKGWGGKKWGGNCVKKK